MERYDSITQYFDDAFYEKQSAWGKEKKPDTAYRHYILLDSTGKESSHDATFDIRLPGHTVGSIKLVCGKYITEIYVRDEILGDYADGFMEGLKDFIGRKIQFDWENTKNE